MDPFIKFNTVTKNNIAKLSIIIKQLVSKSDFISLDTEFTGIKLEQPSDELALDYGKWNNRNKDIGERYKALRLLVSTHSLVSLGMSIFTKKQNESNTTNYISNNFNFILWCQNTHLVSPSSISFLSESGFDFNFQIQQGIRFVVPAPMPKSKQEEGKDKPAKRRATSGSLSNSKVSETNDGRIMRDLIVSVFKGPGSIVIHNGLLDLMFIYHTFIAKLPESISTFIMDICDLASAPIFDTKYLAEYVSRDEASFLAYLYEKRKRYAQSSTNTINIEIRDEIQLFGIDLTPNKQPDDTQQQQTKKTGLPYCETFALYGYCSLIKCPLSHDIKFILDYKEASPQQRKLMKLESDSNNPKPNNTESGKPTINGSLSSYHSAVFDAHMTGYIFAISSSMESVDSHKNKIYLIGKDFPLCIEPSKFSKHSEDYNEFKSKKFKT
ncbi:hypothetical protein BB558_003969 [Smittium angustum]|uniref:C3H1-type domain-containing protein n=1 Tax=Smittium angustum TaxID=133377 RepID=A0A2U1J4Q6_SMIAN|nr:hypothetical protein BB558_003969 [Smittium angustum]